MKLQRITLENFGVFRQRTFDFQGAPIVLVYGANEAGKTTSLNGLRQGIFGFKTRTPYLTGGAMRAEVEAILANGSHLAFARRKGRNDEVTGRHGDKSVGPDEVRELLCGFDVAAYENLFGFSQEELRLGQETLKDVRIAEALAGGTLGGVNVLESLREDLDQTLGDLYKQRGTKSQINQLLSSIEDEREKLRDCELLPTELESLRRELREAEQNAEETQAACVEIQERILHAKLILQALPIFRERQSALARLDALQIPDDLDESFLATSNDFAEQRRELVEAIKHSRERLEREQLQLKILGAEGQDLLQYESEIERLGHRAQQISSLRKKLPALCDERDRSRGERTRLLENLQISDVSEQMLQFSTSLLQQQKLDDLSQQHKQICRELVVTETQLSALDERSEETPENSEALPDDVNELETLVSRLEDHQEQVRELAHSVSSQMTRVKELEQHPELGQASLTTDLQIHWRIPETTEMDRLGQALGSIEQSMAKFEEALKTHQQELAACDLENQGEPSESDEILTRIDNLRQQREGIISHWLDELSQPLIGASISVEQQQERLSELTRIAEATDTNVNAMIMAADSVARESQRRLRRDEIRQLIQKSEAELSKLQDQHSKLHQEWTQLWSHLPVEPRDYVEMSAWLTAYHSWRKEFGQLQSARQQLRRLRSQCASDRDLILDRWPTNLRPDVELKALKQRIDHWKAQKRDIQREIERSKKDLAQRRVLEQRKQDLELKKQAIEQEYSNWLRTVPIHSAWPLDSARTLAESLESLKREHNRHEQVEKQVLETEQTLADYHQAAMKLCQTLEVEFNENCPEVQIEELLSQVHNLRNERTQRERLRISSEHLVQAMGANDLKLQELDRRIATFYASVESDTKTASSLVERIGEACKLRKHLAACDAKLSTLASSHLTLDLVAELQEANEPAVMVEVKRCEEQLADFEAKRKILHQKVGSLQERIEGLAQSDEVQRRSQSIQNLRSELVQLTEQWVVARFAKELLHRSIQLFAQENESQLLSFAQTYLSRLTAGRYIAIEHDKSNKEHFLVRNAANEPFLPDRLSTGTREQLYLALRMAFIRLHCESQEALPVVMDDCFVNFDDKRTEHALEAIASWDNQIQTVILSCHSRIPQILSKVAPDALILGLNNEPPVLASEFDVEQFAHGAS